MFRRLNRWYRNLEQMTAFWVLLACMSFAQFMLSIESWHPLLRCSGMIFMVVWALTLTFDCRNNK